MKIHHPAFPFVYKWMGVVFMLPQVIIRDPFENPVVKDIYKEWVEKSGSEKAKKHMLHTEYHPVVKSITAQLHNW